MREFVGLFRAALAGEKLNHDGPRFRSKGFRLDLPAAEVPVWLGAINPRMLAMAGEIADAVFMTWCPPGEVAPKRAIVDDAAAQSGRNSGDVTTVLSFWAYAGPDPDQAMERMRRQVLAYAMVPTHQPAFVGTFDNLPEVAEAWQNGDRAKALSLVPDEAVLAQCTLGPDMLAERIDGLPGGGRGSAHRAVDGRPCRRRRRPSSHGGRPEQHCRPLRGRIHKVPPIGPRS